MYKIAVIGCLSAFLVLTSRTSASGQFNITGRIVDAETLEPLPFAHVFIDQTTLGVVSDIDGNYVFENLKSGDYRLVFSFVGYELFQTTAQVIDKHLRISVRMVPSQTLIGSLEVKGTRDKEWEKQLKQFEKVFFGDNPYAKQCKIINPEVLEFRIDGERNFRATASEPVLIENYAMGYRINCTLHDFMSNKKEYKINGLFKFDELNTTDPKQALAWTRSRKLAYQNSLRFLFKSIIEKHEAENGFMLFKDNQPELKRPTSGYFADALEKDVFQLNFKDAITPTGRPGFYRISIDGRIEVHHTTTFAAQKTYKDVAYPVSWLEFKKDFAVVSQDGNLINAHELVTMGELNINRVANMLPRDYNPGNMVVINYLTKRKMAKRLQERVFVQTDKSWYYPNEMIWLKAYMGYANQSVRDSLSQVLYVDLLGAQGTIVQSKVLKLLNGMGHGNLRLPFDFEPGQYYLRAYTNWMRNYGAGSSFILPIQIAPLNERLLPSSPLLENSTSITMSAEKAKYLLSDSVHLILSIDTLDFLSGEASIAVTDESQVSVASITPTIADALFFDEELPLGSLLDFVFPVEYGIKIDGHVYHPKKKSGTYGLSVIQGSMDSIFSISTDRRGYFQLRDLQLNDSVDFSFQARDKRGRIVGTTKIQNRSQPLFEKPKTEFQIKPFERISLDKPVYISYKAVPDSTRSKIEPRAEETKTNDTFLSSPNYVFEEPDIKKLPAVQNIFQALIGRVSGLQQNSSTGQLFFRQNARGLAGRGHDALILIDGLPQNNSEFSNSNGAFSSQAISKPNEGKVANNEQTRPDDSAVKAEAVNNNSGVASTENNSTPQSQISFSLPVIDVDDVSRVEISSSGDPRFGHSGANGVIAIFTKRAQGRDEEIKTVDIVKIGGYSSPEKFPPLLNEPLSLNYAPTVYWNPQIHVPKNGARVSFAVPKYPGKYVAVLKGVGSNGVPLSSYFEFEVIPTSLGQRQK